MPCTPDTVKPFGILFFSLYTWDFYSDIMFCVRLADAAQWILFAVGMTFCVVPWTMNLLQLFQAQKRWTVDKSVQEGVRGWLLDWSIVLVVAVCLSGNSFGAIELANVESMCARICAICVLNMYSRTSSDTICSRWA